MVARLASIPRRVRICPSVIGTLNRIARAPSCTGTKLVIGRNEGNRVVLLSLRLIDSAFEILAHIGC